MNRLLFAAVGIALFIAPATAGEPKRTYYECLNPTTDLNFALSYEESDDAISRVSIEAIGMPRLGSDLDTHWKAKRVANRVDFSFFEVSKSLKIKGSMTLIPSSQPGHFGLIWRTQYSGGGATFEDKVGKADCVLQKTKIEGAKPQ